MEFKKLKKIGVGFLLLACLGACSKTIVSKSSSPSTSDSMSSETSSDSEEDNLRFTTADQLEKILSDKDLEEVMSQYGVTSVKLNDEGVWDYDDSEKSVSVTYVFFDKDNKQVGGLNFKAYVYDHTGIEILGAYNRGEVKFHIQNSGQAQELLDTYLDSSFYQQNELPAVKKSASSRTAIYYIPYIDPKIDNGSFIYDQHDTTVQSSFSSMIFLNGKQLLNMEMHFEPKGMYSLKERKVSPAIIDALLTKISENTQDE